LTLEVADSFSVADCAQPMLLRASTCARKNGVSLGQASSLTVASNQALNWSHMRIYIDEAGPFVVAPSAQPLFSLVLAVVVPSCVEQALFAEFSVLRDGWSNQRGEVKGSKLDESQAAQLIELASRYDVFVNFFAIDMARHDDDQGHLG
jgi:hypothetical protein